MSMANMLDNLSVKNIAKHRNKLMTLVESTKKRKKKKQKKWAVPPSNIEHLVFKKIPTSPIDPGPTLNGTRLDASEDDDYHDHDQDAEYYGYDDLDATQLAGSDANILRKRAASTSDYSPKSKATQRPVSVADYLTLENSHFSKVPDGKHDLTTKASSENEHSENQQQRNLASLDQIWRTNPVKLCRVHSRLMMCRHKGRYRLRRSISQPVELEMSGSIHNLRNSNHGSADNETFQKMPII